MTKKINPSLEKQIVNSLVQALLDMKNSKEMGVFLKDFLTPTEFENLAKRLAVAYWLKKKRTRQNIKDNLKVSPMVIINTASKMNKSGIKLALKKIEAEEWATKWEEKIRNTARKIS